MSTTFKRRLTAGLLATTLAAVWGAAPAPASSPRGPAAASAACKASGDSVRSPRRCMRHQQRRTRLQTHA